MFEFYYQTGEFLAESGGFWDSFLGFIKDASVQIVGTILGGIIALSLYLQEVDDQALKEQRGRLQKHVDNLRYLHFLLKDSIESIESFSETLYRLADDLTGQFSKVPDFNFSKPIQSISRIANVVNQQEIYHSYQELVLFYKFSTDRNEISNIFQIVDVVNFNIPEFQKHYLEFSSLLISSYNELIKCVGEQNTQIAYLKIKQYDSSISEPLNRIKTEYISAAKNRPDRWFQHCLEKQNEIWKFFSEIDFKVHEEVLVPINNLNSDISQLLINIEGHSNSFRLWATSNAPDMYGYANRLRSKTQSLESFLKEREGDVFSSEVFPQSFISRTLRMFAALIKKS